MPPRAGKPGTTMSEVRQTQGPSCSDRCTATSSCGGGLLRSFIFSRSLPGSASTSLKRDEEVDNDEDEEEEDDDDDDEANDAAAAALAGSGAARSVASITEQCSTPTTPPLAILYHASALLADGDARAITRKPAR